ncbi:hypothetical protein V8F33_011719 [Rhypophila sp. PSN 637]
MAESLSADGPANETNDLGINDGRRTEIADYCEYRIEKGVTRCIFLCFKRGRQHYATDLEVDGSLFGIDNLRKHPVCGRWWKRYSLYSTTGVKAVLIRIVNCNFHASYPASTSIRVATTDFTYSDKIAKYDRIMSRMADEEDTDPYSCGLDVNGKSHEDLSSCGNTGYDQFDEQTYCTVDRYRRLAYLRDEYKWMHSLLECYWQHGVDGKGLAFLDKMCFIQSALKFDQHEDAANPYGRTIKGFELIEGWHTTYLLVLIFGTPSG